jgi:hypothetical protein
MPKHSLNRKLNWLKKLHVKYKIANIALEDFSDFCRYVLTADKQPQIKQQLSALTSEPQFLDYLKDTHFNAVFIRWKLLKDLSKLKNNFATTEKLVLNNPELSNADRNKYIHDLLTTAEQYLEKFSKATKIKKLTIPKIAYEDKNLIKTLCDFWHQVAEKKIDGTAAKRLEYVWQQKISNCISAAQWQQIQAQRPDLHAQFQQALDELWYYSFNRSNLAESNIKSSYVATMSIEWLQVIGSYFLATNSKSDSASSANNYLHYLIVAAGIISYFMTHYLHHQDLSANAKVIPDVIAADIFKQSVDMHGEIAAIEQFIKGVSELKQIFNPSSYWTKGILHGVMGGITTKISSSIISPLLSYLPLPKFGAQLLNLYLLRSIFSSTFKYLTATDTGENLLLGIKKIPQGEAMKSLLQGNKNLFFQPPSLNEVKIFETKNLPTQTL